MMTHYDVLRVAPDATEKEIKASYRALAQQLHPDMEGGDKEAFQTLQAAYAVLHNKEKRAAYDRGESVSQSLEDRIESEAIKSILGLLAQIADTLTENSVDHRDLRALMLSSIQDGFEKIKREKKSTKGMLRKFRKMKKRLRSDEFIFAGWIHQQRQRQLETYKNHLFVERVVRRMKELAESVEYEFEAPPLSNSYASFASGFPPRSF